MKRATRHFARLYPAAWRRRYGAEFDALLEETRPTAGSAWNVLMGAFAMQIRTWSFLRVVGIAVLCGLAYLSMAVVLSPARYVATETVKVNAAPGADVTDSLAVVTSEARSRLLLFIQISKWGLYRNDRMREPMDAVIERMRRDLSISPMVGFQSGLTIRFAYPDARVAQKVTEAVADEIISASRDSADYYRYVPERPLLTDRHAKYSLQVLDAAKVDSRPLSRWLALKRLDETTVGLAIVFAAIAGTVMGWIFLGRTGRIACCSAWAFVVIAWAGCKLLPKTYESSGTILVNGPVDVAKLLNEGISLDRVIFRLGSDGSERAKTAEDALAAWARESMSVQQILSAKGDVVALSFRFAYSNPLVAQRITQDMMARVIEAHSLGNSGDGYLNVLDQATLPMRPVSPRVDVIVLIAFLIGWTLPGLLGFFRRPAAGPGIPAVGGLVAG